MSRMRRAHRARDGGLLLIRIAVGATIAAHGAQKLFGWFGGHGIDGTAAMFHQGGFRPARHHAVAAGLVEAGSGTLLALGLVDADPSAFYRLITPNGRNRPRKRAPTTNHVSTTCVLLIGA